MFINDAKYIKVWEVEQKENYVKGNLGESEKNTDGTYNNWFWTAKFVGKSKETAIELQKGDTIEIKGGKVRKFKYNDKWYDELIIFEYEIMNRANQSTSQDDDDLPF